MVTLELLAYQKYFVTFNSAFEHCFRYWLDADQVTSHYPVFKTNGRPVAPGNQKMGWTSWIWPWASKNYNSLYKEGNVLNISGWLREKFSVIHWLSEQIMVMLPMHIYESLGLNKLKPQFIVFRSRYVTVPSSSVPYCHGTIPLRGVRWFLAGRSAQ